MQVIFRQQNVMLFALCLIAIGLPLSPALMSIGQGVLILSWLVFPKSWPKWSEISKQREVFVFLLIFILHIVGLLYTSNFAYAWKDIRIKLPLLLIPLTVLFIVGLEAKHRIIIYLTVLVATLISSAYSMYIYSTIDFSRVDTLRSISPIISHIRLSLICCVSIFLAFHLFQNSKNTIVRVALIAAAVWLLLFIGILGARAGYLSIMISATAIGCFELLRKNMWKTLVLAVVLAVTIPLAMYNYIGSVKKRVNEVFFEIDNYNKGGNPSGHSITQRFVYWGIAKNIFQSSPVIGVGTGDIDDAYKRYYATHTTPLSKEFQFRAHNQYFTVLCTFGIVGLIVFLFSLFFPFYARGGFENKLGTALLIIIMLSMLTEDTLETQAGATFLAYFYSLFILLIPAPNKQ